MRLFLDLQATQGASRYRGIGRYSFEFARALVRAAGEHEVWLGFSDRFPMPWDQISEICADRIPRERVVSFDLGGRSAEADPINQTRASADEKIREAFIADLQPDLVHVSSLFEGYVEDNTTSIASFEPRLRTSVTLYDLIPLLRPDSYLLNDAHRGWYLRKIDALRRANLMLAISASAKSEAVEHLGIAADLISVVHAGVSDHFRRRTMTDGDRDRLRTTYGLDRPYVMYTANLDPRKNVDLLIEAFAQLPAGVRNARQLVIVTPTQPPIMERLLSLSLKLGMKRGQLIFVGSISDEDLCLLYSGCDLFVFPSLHEGFGLPILEAMACGAPVIASSSSSMPEVVGRSDALFDPTKPQSIAAKMLDVISAPAFAQSLRDNAGLRVQQFSWEKTADIAWRGFESAVDRTPGATARSVRSDRKRRLAYFSPLPPHHSGISDYSAELLPELSVLYDIDVVVDQSQVSDAWIVDTLPIRTVDWFEKNASEFDRILYNVGNSPFHEYMLDVMKRWPGVVILHDLYLSSLFRFLGQTRDPRQWFERLFDSHGLPAVRQFPGMAQSAAASGTYPCSLSIVEDAIGVLVHSDHAIGLARELLGARAASSIKKIRFPRRSSTEANSDRGEARKRLGIDDNTLLVCSFGHLADTKLSHRLVDVWLHAGFADNSAFRMIFVGDAPPDYERLLRQTIGRSSLIQITGHVDRSRYREYLVACDVAVQLRAGSRGETSAGAFDCLAHGIPLIVNAHGSMGELPDDVVLKLPDAFSEGELAEALLVLLNDEERRRDLGARGLEFARAHHDPRQVALRIHEAMEVFETEGKGGRLKRLVAELGDPESGLADADLGQIARATAANQVSVRPPKMLLDVSELAKADRRTGIERVVRNFVNHLTAAPSAYRAELVTVGRELRYARSFAARHFDLPTIGSDRSVGLAAGDIFLGLDLNAGIAEETLGFLRRKNVTIAFIVYDILPVTHPQYFLPSVSQLFAQWLISVTLHADALVCISRDVADEVHR